MKRKLNEQEKFWAGNFGDEYIERNKNPEKIRCNINLFAKIFNKLVFKPENLLELGANIGLNLIAIHELLLSIKIDALEINKKAISYLKKLPFIDKIYHQSVLEFSPTKEYDFVLTKGFLIHIHPNDLNYVYEVIYKSSRRYICLIEYYNPTPVEVLYRGYHNKLFKIDFAGEIMDRYKDLFLVSYGFI